MTTTTPTKVDLSHRSVDGWEQPGNRSSSIDRLACEASPAACGRLLLPTTAAAARRKTKDTVRKGHLEEKTRERERVKERLFVCVVYVQIKAKISTFGAVCWRNGNKHTHMH